MRVVIEELSKNANNVPTLRGKEGNRTFDSRIIKNNAAGKIVETRACPD
jgi:hypothetical protein